MARNRSPAGPSIRSMRNARDRRRPRRMIRVQVGPGALDLEVPDGMEPDALRARVERWMAGAGEGFDDIATPGGTPFQRACWDACRRIPRGETRTYAWLAAAAGSPAAVRAAGQAMRRNPLPIVVPCHRVAASGGRPGGFSGSSGPDSLAIKRHLQEVERGSDR
ncbi:MAG: methylated-DNA--[protein]-cysteine S-methyltransferase [Phycisphaerales bacterium]|nr:methylated-DNA--[protein]-cysteine S-methyltransferase [Phycisphaerales bacterium]